MTNRFNPQVLKPNARSIGFSDECPRFRAYATRCHNRIANVLQSMFFFNHLAVAGDPGPIALSEKQGRCLELRRATSDSLFK